MAARTTIPGLDGMRGIAAVVVVACHLNQHFHNRLHTPWVLGEAGPQAVRFFFTLSGFLITYLLREEQAASGGVDVGRFYVRRILRIWPVYYLGLAIAVFVIPHVVGYSDFFRGRAHAPSATTLTLYLCLCPNIAELFYSGILGVQQYWSLGVEEQFYLIWPWLMRLPRRSHAWIMGAVVAAKLAALLIAAMWFTSLTPILEDFNVECMAIGGLAAVVLTERPRWVEYLRAQSWLKLVVICLFVIGIASRSLHPLALVGDAIVSSALILWVGHAAGPRWLNARWLVAPGRWSYGIYVYHLIVMIVAATMLGLVLAPGHLYDAAIIVATCGLTVAVSAASSRWFEAPFLRMKPRS